MQPWIVRRLVTWCRDGPLEGANGKLTDLRPRELGQAADELRRGVDAEAERLFVDDLADAVPEGGFETLFVFLVREVGRVRLGSSFWSKEKRGEGVREWLETGRWGWGGVTGRERVLDVTKTVAQSVKDIAG